MQKGRNLRELVYLSVACLSHIRYHGVLLAIDAAVNWLSLGTSFGTFSATGTRM